MRSCAALRRGAAILLASIAAISSGCGLSYVYRSPEEYPLRGARVIAVDLDARVAPGLESMLPRLAALREPLRLRLALEQPEARFVEPGREPAEVRLVVRLDASLAFTPPTPYEIGSGALRVDTFLDVWRGEERVALVQGRADGWLVTFHELLDPDLERTLDRTARRLLRMLADLGLTAQRTR